MQVACPRCQTPVEWNPAAKFRPFCSERCKMADLGAWANEKYVISSDTQTDDETTGTPDA